MMNTSPIKRNQSLVALSKEHHFGLLASWKIRRGFDLNIEPNRIAAFVFNFWETHLSAHFMAEEEFLFGAIKHKLVDEALQQHLELKTLLQLIKETKTPEHLANFADLLEQHIRFEERQVFKILQQQLSEKKLKDIGQKLKELHAEPIKDNYEDEFWLATD